MNTDKIKNVYETAFTRDGDGNLIGMRPTTNTPEPRNETRAVQVEYSREAAILAAQYRAIGNPSFNLGKTCAICGIPILNTFKVLTCQDCRHEQHLTSKQVSNEYGNQLNPKT